MISYAPFWRLMKEKGVTTYTLRAKAFIGSATVYRLMNNEPVSTNTLDTLCRLFNCELGDIAQYIPDEEYKE